MISVVIPVYNGESTLVETLKSLISQRSKFSELIIIDDGSTDRSIVLLEEYFKGVEHLVPKIIRHKKSQGLAASYNQGFKLAEGELVVTIHQDIILKNEAFGKLIQPFFAPLSDKVVASTHIADYPYEVWKKYNFWQKVFFSRLVGGKFYGLDGKFDCFRKSAVKKIGMFDDKRFKTAGEDGDIVYRLNKIGVIIQSRAEIVHLHRNDSRFGIKDIIFKQAQYSEAQGALLRKGTIRSLVVVLKTFFRELLLLSLLIPYIRFLGVAIIIAYSFAYSYRVFVEEYKNPRILTLPFLNVWLLFISLFFSLKGYILGRQGM